MEKREGLEREMWKVYIYEESRVNWSWILSWARQLPARYVMEQPLPYSDWL